MSGSLHPDETLPRRQILSVYSCTLNEEIACWQTHSSTSTQQNLPNSNYLIHTSFACRTSAPDVNCTMYNPDGRAPASITAL